MAAQISVADLTAIGNSTRDGFTGHEMLDGVGLIHMNGRVYDPAVGRFLSVDPLVREAAASQSWNGYGYVEGRVLSAIDPNGYSLAGLSVRGFIRRIEGRASGSTSGGAGASGGGALETVVVEATRLYPPPWVSFDSGMRNGRGSTEGGGSGGSGGGAATEGTEPQGDPCPGVGQVTPAPKEPFDPSMPISSFVTDLPAGSISVTAPDRTVFNAPGYADFAGAYTYGQSLRSIPFGLDAFGLQVAVGHGGMYDFQRDGQTFIRPYVYASNYAVGIVLNGAGYSRANAIRIAGGFARLGSSNAGDPAQLRAWTNGWNAAASGSCTRTN